MHTHQTEADQHKSEQTERSSGHLLVRAARMLQPQGSGLADDGCEENSSMVGCAGYMSTDNSVGAHSPSRGADALDTSSVAAATLDEGARPVRELPNNLTSEPASLAHSCNSSVVGSDYADESKRLTRSHPSADCLQQEELRCVLAIIRHGDRTPKQKLKLEMKEPHILDFFHRQ